MVNPSLSVDCVIFGGGAAGLWLLNRLRQAGLAAVLLEAHALGAGQTISSQGILHSGLKYSLKGLVSAAAREAREMPAVWRRCLAGEEAPSLQTAEVLSENFYLWGTDSAASRLGMFGAKLGLKVTPQAVPVEDRPPLLRDCRGSVYRVDEQVLSPASILAALAQQHKTAIFQIDPAAGLDIEPPTASRGPVIRLHHAGQTVEIHPRWTVLAAGAGNERLRSQLGLPAGVMQRRPLHMVMMRGPLPSFFGHCVDGGHTRVSITSAIDTAGRTVWQVGGQIAEDGVTWEPSKLIAAAQAEVASVLPTLNLSLIDWATYAVDRAEGATRGGGRPDSFRITQDHNILTIWPTKLVLVPQLAEAVLPTVAAGCPAQPSVPAEHYAAPLQSWPRPAVAQPPWETATFLGNSSALKNAPHKKAS